VPIKENPNASPSLWYMPLVGGEHFFDGFGFEEFRAEFGWPEIPLDANERKHPPKNPLLPFIKRANETLPEKWDRARERFGPNDDWLLWDLRRVNGGAEVQGPKEEPVATR
jgi:hypothetical protein